MFCRNCGRKLNDGDVFCLDCGTPVQRPSVQSEKVPQKSKASKTKKSPVMLIVIILLVIAIIAGGLVAWFVISGEDRDTDDEEYYEEYDDEDEEDEEETFEALEREDKEDIKTEEDETDRTEAEDSRSEQPDETVLVKDTAEADTAEAEESVEKSTSAADETVVVDSEPAEPAITMESDPLQFFILNSSTHYFSKNDIADFDADQCRKARNGIYARHGRKFNDTALQNFFFGYDWYEPTIDADDFQESVLNEYEIANRDLIIEFETEKGYR